MKENSKCEMICDGIKDEIEGQKFYEKLYKHVHENSSHKVMVNIAHNDEEKHERYLRIMSSMNNCRCK